MFQPLPPYLPPRYGNPAKALPYLSTPGSVTLTGNTSTFSITGYTVLMNSQRTIVATTATTVLTGNSGNTQHNYLFRASQQSYSFTGIQSSGAVGVALVGTTRSYVLSTKSGRALVGKKIIATTSSITLASSSTNLIRGSGTFANVLELDTPHDGSNGNSQWRTTGQYSGDLLITGKVRRLVQYSTPALDYQAPSVAYHAPDTALLTGYKVEFLTDGLQLSYNQSPLTDNFGVSFTDTAWYDFSISYTASTATHSISINGTEYISFVDISGSSGYFGFLTLNSKSQFDNIGGTVADTFDTYDPNTIVPSGGVVGPWTNQHSGGGVTTIKSLGYSLTGIARAILLTGVDSRTLNGKIITGTQQTFTETGNDAIVLRNYRLTADTASFGVTAPSPTFDPNKFLTGFTRSFDITANDGGLLRGKILGGTTYVIRIGIMDIGLRAGRLLNAVAAEFELDGNVMNVGSFAGHSRGAMIQMFQNSYMKQQSEIRRQFAAHLGSQQAIKTPQKSVKKASNTQKRKRQAFKDELAALDDVWEPKHQLPPVPTFGALTEHMISQPVPQHGMTYSAPAQPVIVPDDEEAISLLLHKY